MQRHLLQQSRFNHQLGPRITFFKRYLINFTNYFDATKITEWKILNENFSMKAFFNIYYSIHKCSKTSDATKSL